ncbi:MAG TPA: ATP-grasp domain-containing protein [Streptosporangiaceae bacterium]|nr:ATP-grasp domain-containing protein [Streptosporangiaceae bacterium]
MADLVVIGVPWNSHELEATARAARDLGLGMLVADTADQLAMVTSPLFGRLDVASMTEDCLSAAIRATGARWVVSTTQMKLELAARVRECLGLPGNPSSVERTVGDKMLARAALRDASLTGVRHWRATVAELPDILRGIPLPVVIKPRTLAGSNGVRLVSQPGDLPDALSQYTEPSAEILLEQYLPGTEISVEGLVRDGQLTIFSLTDKVNTGPPYFQEIGHIMPSSETLMRAGEARRYLQRIVAELGIVTAPVHAELKLQDSGLDLIEIHTRFGGGNIVRLLAEAAGIDPFGEYLSAVTGGQPPSRTVARSEEVWGVGFYTARVGRQLQWKSFEVPHPGAVVQIDLDRRRGPKLTEFRGVRIRYWRAGHAMFCSASYQEVYENVASMATTLGCVTK